MNIGSIFNTITQAVDQATAVTKQTSAQGAQSTSGTGADQSSVSGPAQMLSQLQQLQAQDPTKFKQVMSSIASTLQKDAKSASDPQAQHMLNDLASRFQKAGDTGDLSALQPPSGGPGGPPPGGGPGGPPPGGAAPGGAPGGGEASTTSSSSSSKTHDPADTNYDGKVSAEERLAYASKQASTTSHKLTSALASVAKMVDAHVSSAR